MHRVIPAQQRLHADQVLGVSSEKRLIDELELVAGGKRVAQFRLDGAAALDRRVHLVLEDAEAVAALELGAIERDIRLADELGPVHARLGRDRHADRHADERRAVEDVEGARHRLDDALAKGRDILLAADLRLDDGELVAAEPRHAVGAAHQAGEPLRELADQVVAGRVAERVVDVLEAVEVEIEQREPLPGLARFDQGAIEPVAEQRPVGEAGQRVVEGEVLGLRLARLQLGRGPLQAQDQERDDQRDDEKGAEQERRHPGQQPPARPVRLPDEVADGLPGVVGKRDRRLAGGRIVVPGEAGAFDQILLHHRVEEAAVEEANADMQGLGAGGLLDLAGIGDDRDDTRERGSTVRTTRSVTLKLAASLSNSGVCAHRTSQLLDQGRKRIARRGEVAGSARAPSAIA